MINHLWDKDGHQQCEHQHGFCNADHHHHRHQQGEARFETLVIGTQSHRKRRTVMHLPTSRLDLWACGGHRGALTDPKLELHRSRHPAVAMPTYGSLAILQTLCLTLKYLPVPASDWPVQSLSQAAQQDDFHLPSDHRVSQRKEHRFNQSKKSDRVTLQSWWAANRWRQVMRMGRVLLWLQWQTPHVNLYFFFLELFWKTSQLGECSLPPSWRPRVGNPTWNYWVRLPPVWNWNRHNHRGGSTGKERLLDNRRWLNPLGKRNLLWILQGFGHLSVNSDSIDKKRFGFGEEFNQTGHLLQRKADNSYFNEETMTLILQGECDKTHGLCILYAFITSWESMSTKQKHLAPGGFALTKRTFLSSRYAKGSKAFRMASTDVLAFTFFNIMAGRRHPKHFGDLKQRRRQMKPWGEPGWTYFYCLWKWIQVCGKGVGDGRGWPKARPDARSVVVWAACPLAAARPLGSSPSCAATGSGTEAPRSLSLRNRWSWSLAHDGLVVVTGAPGVVVPSDPLPKMQSWGYMCASLNKRESNFVK